MLLEPWQGKLSPAGTEGLAQDHTVMPDEALFLLVAGQGGGGGVEERRGREWEKISLCAGLLLEQE